MPDGPFRQRLRDDLKNFVAINCRNPKAMNIHLLYSKLRKLWANGARRTKLVVPLQPEWDLGKAFIDRYSEVREVYPEMPEIEWQGRHDSDLKGDYVTPDTAAAAVWHAIQAEHKVAMGHPFEDRLAALKRN